MTDYKKTLNLPETDFSMKANLAAREPLQLKRWQEMDLYAALRQQGRGLPRFIMHDGPPYANGHIHVGHALNKILKDFIVKSKTLSGYDVPFVPGWDCHGLPIEHQVEKKHGKPGHKLSVQAFRQACRDYAATQIDIQRHEFIRLGVIADWQKPYVTMDYVYEANIIRSLAKIIARGHLKKGYRPVHWCLDCASALAEAEVEYADKTSPAIDVSFAVVDQAELLKRFQIASIKVSSIALPIWTTTPWTLPANQAVSLHPALMYALVQHEDRAFIIAEGLLPQVTLRYGMKDNHQVLSSLRGDELSGLLLQHPFYERQVPIVLGEHVTVDTGTGAVHTAPAHGEDDFEMGKQYQLPLDNPVGDDGCYTNSTHLFAGMHVSKVNDAVIQVLKERGALIKQETIVHSYPHCWRHKTPLIFRATPQWFISMDQAKLREHALAGIELAHWVPDWGQARIAGMVAERPDWCISRQRVWGVPIALFTHKETGELHPDTLSLMEKVAALVERDGVDAWFQLDAATLLGADASNYNKVTDILDVWFDSGVSHECVLQHRPELQFPADIILEGSDQHRGWFQSQLLSSAAINDAAPYKTVLTHGFTVDGEGRKMSKSLGNVIAPIEVTDTLGAYILRLLVASVDYRGEIPLSQAILTRNVEAYRRIRNTARFLLANLHGFDPALHLVARENMLALDQYIVAQAASLQRDIIAAYDAYQYHVIVQKIQHFCVNELGGFYLDIIKDRQYTMQEGSLARRSAQTALFHIAEAFVRWLAPVLSFTAEEIFSFLPGKRADSVLLTTWYDRLQEFTQQENVIDWSFVRMVRDEVNKEIENKRAQGVLGSSLEANVQIHASAPFAAKLKPLHDELRFVLITSKATLVVTEESLASLTQTSIPGLQLSVTKIEANKCVRCWHRRDEVGRDAKHPELCQRCIVNVDGTGEDRLYA